MKVSVMGIGYVGATATACLAEQGHDVIAVDISPVKVTCINEGRSPIVETRLPELMKKGYDAGRIRATQDYEDAIMNTEISLICVGTPSRPDGSLNLQYIEDICARIGEQLKKKDGFHTVVNRSTVVPGTLRNVIQPIIEEHSGKKAGVGFGLGNNPEFLRESTAVEDYFHPTQIVIGAIDERSADTIAGLYEGIEAPMTITDVGVAEGVKYVSNAWRATKVGFANEMGNMLKRHGVDSHKVMDIFFLDDKINLGKSFLMPGFSFGGSCLPKDIRALRASANDMGLPTPVFDALLRANELQVLHALDMIRNTGKKRVALLGLSFKPGTDDLRESPLVALAELLIKEGYTLKIYDPCVYEAAHMDGANREYIEKGIPHISGCIVPTPEDILNNGSEVFVLGNGTKEFAGILNRTKEDMPIIDLVRLNGAYESRKSYAGICW
ncbi:MAG: UDP-glucose/GDP-mannose dehydrogenase family protein [Alphaproteobacteria bacterium]|nr:UDP-glucose/GDP-mannose dehydrogenase family protein [Alphaproteobacteria bacterium]